MESRFMLYKRGYDFFILMSFDADYRTIQMRYFLKGIFISGISNAPEAVRRDKNECVLS
jgi:hypothetical protein